MQTFSQLLILADKASGQGEGGSSMMPLILLLLLGLMIFMMTRSRKKQQRAAQEHRDTLSPGMEVMTGSGIFGTIRHVDRDENKVMLEVSPGVVMTVHLQAIVPQNQIPGADAKNEQAETAEEDGLDETGNRPEYGSAPEGDSDQDNQDK